MIKLNIMDKAVFRYAVKQSLKSSINGQKSLIRTEVVICTFFSMDYPHEFIQAGSAILRFLNLFIP